MQVFLFIPVTESQGGDIVNRLVAWSDWQRASKPGVVRILRGCIEQDGEVLSDMGSWDNYLLREHEQWIHSAEITEVKPGDVFIDFDGGCCTGADDFSGSHCTGIWGLEPLLVLRSPELMPGNVDLENWMLGKGGREWIVQAAIGNT